jgi:CBS domain-containing protein
MPVAARSPQADDGGMGASPARERSRKGWRRCNGSPERGASYVGCGLVPGSNREAAMNVKDILAQKGDDVLTIEPTATLAAAMEILARRRIGALVITGADRRIVGIISERDIVRVLVERGTEMLQSPVSEIMTRKVVSCGQNETIAEIMGRMTAGKFRHVPVVEQGRLIGIVSIGDIVKARLEELEKEQDALRDYIRTA